METTPEARPVFQTPKPSVTFGKLETGTALATKLSALCGELDPVLMNGHNSFQKYDYRKADDFVDKMREPLAKYKLHMSFSVPSESISTGTRKTSNGEAQYVWLEVIMRIVDAESGEFMDISTPGYAYDTQDKAVWKAITGAKKYAIDGLFNLRGGIDPESESGDKTTRKRGGQTGAAQAGMPADKRARFYTRVAMTKIADSVTSNVVATVTNGRCSAPRDPSIVESEAQQILAQLEALAKRRDAAEKNGGAQESQTPAESGAAAAPEQEKTATLTPIRATASASASARANAGSAASPEFIALKQQIRDLAKANGVDDEALTGIIKTASRNYASSLDDPKFNARDAASVLSIMNGGAPSNKYGEPPFASATA